MDGILEYSIPAIELVQRTFAPWESQMLILSHAGDPKNAFSLYFPLVFGLSAVVGRKILFGAVAAEWLNIVLKWLLFGERPYWWVEENIYKSDIKQFKLTCETGPGSPSGHVMVTAVIYYIILDSFNQVLNRRFKIWLPLMLYAIMASAIGISRVFIAAHFPHQIIGGFLAAYMLNVLLKHVFSYSYSLRTYILCAIFLFGSAIGLNMLLQLINIDFNWSVKLAIKHCAIDSWISLNTTPYNSIVRVSSALFGYGIAEQFLNKKFTPQLPKSSFMKLTNIFLNLCLCTTFESLTLPTSFLLFYLFSSIKYIFIPICVVHVIPLVLSSVLNLYNKRKVD